MTGSEGLLGPAVEIGRQIKQVIRQELRLVEVWRGSHRDAPQATHAVGGHHEPQGGTFQAAASPPREDALLA